MIRRTRRRKPRPQKLRRFRPAFDSLENRLVPATTITVDATAGLHAIDPRIYGVNSADQSVLADTNIPFNRSGGNTASRYNWQQNASNHANDWFYESLEDGPAVPAGM